MKSENITKTIKILDAEDIEANNKDLFARDVLDGLSVSSKNLSSRYFYDEKGSELFQKITALDEYYLTGCEFEILQKYSGHILSLIQEVTDFKNLNIVELGAGDGHKTVPLLKEVANQKYHHSTYIPIDISKSALEELMQNLEKDVPSIATSALVSEYFTGLKWLSSQNHGRNFVIFLGSNIGNFSFARAESFLRRLWHSLNNKDIVLIGFDLKKEINIMLRAYSDSENVTKEFNINLLRRINNELGANFDLAKFDHYALYNPTISAMESYIISRVQQTVEIEYLNKSFRFSKNEGIHTEYSYKYDLEEIEKLANATGYNIIRNYQDSREYFVDSLWQVFK